MANTARTTRTGLSPIFIATNVLVWISAVIVMGILSYFISLNNKQGSHVIYEEVIAVLTVAFFLAAFVLETAHILLLNLIFSYLWLVAVAFTASDWSYKYAGALVHTVEAFSFIAFFCLLFNVLYSWHTGFRGAAGRTTSSV